MFSWLWGHVSPPAALGVAVVLAFVVGNVPGHLLPAPGGQGPQWWGACIPSLLETLWAMSLVCLSVPHQGPPWAMHHQAMCPVLPALALYSTCTTSTQVQAPKPSMSAMGASRAASGHEHLHDAFCHISTAFLAMHLHQVPPLTQCIHGLGFRVLGLGSPAHLHYTPNAPACPSAHFSSIHSNAPASAASLDTWPAGAGWLQGCPTLGGVC